MYMGFRENLKTELTYTGMLVKELSVSTGISKHTIDNYLSTNNYMPSAENAVKIAQVLGVSVEYLVTGRETCREKSLSSLNPDIRALIQAAERLDEKNRRLVLDLVEALLAGCGGTKRSQ
jgi:transcriptional regulator with XRE-family HTH domain